MKDGDLVFLAGNPGPTGRLSTAAQLTFLRDTALPLSLTRLQPRLQQLNTFAAANETNLRAAQATLSAMLTIYKSDAGKLIGLRDDRLVTRKTNFEGKIRRVEACQARPKPAKSGTKCQRVCKWSLTKSTSCWNRLPHHSRLFHTARQIVRQKLDDSATRSATPWKP